MVQLKIGKKDEQEKPKDPYAYMDDKEIEETEKEVNEFYQIDPENLRVEDFNFDPKIITEFRDTHPEKNIIYHNSLTKQFLEFYITHADTVEQLERITFDILEGEQNELISDAIEEFQMVEGIKKVNGEEGKETDAERIIDTHTDTQREKYEFILDQKYDDREKGIQNLDKILREAIETSENYNDIDSALEYCLSIFDLDHKWKKYQGKKKDEIKNKEKGTPKHIRGSINYFHKLEFLYEFMGTAMMFKDEYEVSDEEIDKIKEIKLLLRKGDT